MSPPHRPDRRANGASTARGDAPAPAAALLAMPGLRVFARPAFRVVLAGVLLASGVVVLGLVLLRQAADPGGQYGFDVQAYQAAARAIADGGSPYGPSMFAGPVPAQGEVLYKYPPPLAQLLSPAAALPAATFAAGWLALQAVAVVAGVLLALVAGGARLTLERLLWTGVAVTFFLPVFDTLWKGNVSGLQALQVGLLAVGGTAGGVGIASALLLKTTPAPLLALAAARRGRVLRSTLVMLAAATVVSVLLSPVAWWDFTRALPNLLSGPSVFPTNLAPHSLVATALPDLPILSTAARLAAVALAVAALVGSVRLARRRDGWHAGVVLATAGVLLLPSAIWFHYLCVLLPVAALAWSAATGRQRVALVVGGAAVSAGVVSLVLALLGGVVLVVAAFAAVRPRVAAPGSVPATVLPADPVPPVAAPAAHGSRIPVR